MHIEQINHIISIGRNRQIYVPSPQTTPYNTITKQQSSGGAEQARTNIRQWQPQEQLQQQGEQLAGPHRYGTRGVIRFLKNRIYPVFSKVGL